MTNTRTRRRRSRRLFNVRIRHLIVFGVTAVLVAATLYAWRAGLFTTHDATAYLRAGEQRRQAGDLAAAIVNFKSAVQIAPNDAESRAMLGSTYLQAGNGVVALKELKRARELGRLDTSVNQGIVRALIAVGQLDQAATELNASGTKNDAGWLLLQGLLDAAAGRHADAKQAFAAVLAKEPEQAEARRGLVEAELRLGNLSLARAAIAKALELDQHDRNLWVLKGQLELQEVRFEAARTAFATALELAPHDLAATLGITTALIPLERVAEASSQLDGLGVKAAEDPRVLYLRALIAKQKKQPQAALSFVKKVLQVVPNHRDSLVLAAGIHFQAGNYGLAEDYVNQLLTLDPNDSHAQKMLAAVRLASGRLEPRPNDIDGIDPEKQTDPGMFALLGSAYLRNGRIDASEQSFARAQDLAPDSTPIQIQLMLTKLAARKHDEAAAILDKLALREPNDPKVNTLKVMLALARDDNNAALTAAQGFVAMQPGNAVALNLLAYVYEASGQIENAQQAYTKALQADPAFLAAQYNLARLDLAHGDEAAATRRYNAILEQQPHAPEALVALAALAEKAGADERVLALLEEAREQNPTAVTPRVLLARYYLRQRNFTLAESFAVEAYKLAPYAPFAQHQYVLAMLADNKPALALPAITALASRFPDSVPTLRLQVTTYARLHDLPKIESSLKRILEIVPEDAEARRALAFLAMDRGDEQAARGIAEAMIGVDKTRAEGVVLLGDIYRAGKHVEQAVAQYAKAFELAPARSTLLKLESAETELGIDHDRLNTWLKTNSDDQRVRLAYAQRLQTRGAKTQAITEYERVISQNPKDAVALNNLAWLYEEGGDQRALEIAKRAYENLPESPAIADTYGWILFRRAQYEQALKLIERAAGRAGDDRDIRFHLGSVLAKLGKHDGARQQLREILKDDQPFASRADAMALRAELEK